MTSIPMRRLAPELVVSDLETSLEFYRRADFEILWERRAEKFVFLNLDGAHLMLEQVSDADWIRAPLEKPYGRGINFQIIAPDVQIIRNNLKDAPIIRDIMDKTYQTGDTKRRFRELMVADPDGYVLRFQQCLD